MIKLFRHIRRSLIQQNKMGKYFKYAIGEIFLVVIGILIALSINNWNEAQKEEALELDYLTGIKTDLESNINTAEYRISRILHKISALHKIDSTFITNRGIETHDISLDSVKIGYLFNRGPSFRLISGTYKALTSNASAGLIKNTQLFQSIQELYEVSQLATNSVYSDLKRREEYVGWKYAKELKNSDLQTFFMDNPNKKEVLADFDYYYRQQVLMCRQFMNKHELMLQIIDDINTELEQR